MSTDVRTLRPGLLVNMATGIGGGNVQYERHDKKNGEVGENGQQISEWEMRKIVVDPAEHAEAVKIRGKARSLVTGVATQTSFGLLCPTDREPELREKIVEARQLVWEFNQRAVHTQISFNTICGRVAQDDVEAVQAISIELRELLTTMERGVQELDVAKIRDAAQKMRNTGQLLSVDVKKKVDEIVGAARKQARKIAKAGEAAAEAVDAETLAQLRAARTAFLDLDADDDNTSDDDQGQQLADEMRAAGTRAVDFDAWNDWDEDPDTGQADAPAAPASDTQDDVATPVTPAIEMDWDDADMPVQDDDTTTADTSTEGI